MNYKITGRVVKGDGYGRKIGFPTANLDRRAFSLLAKKPALGVYSGYVRLSDDRVYKAGIVIGPEDNIGLPKLEAHLIGFDGDLYDQKITFEIEKFIRKFQNFKTEKELIEQIKKDLKECLRV